MASATLAVTAGDELKIDDTFGVNAVTTANWSITFEVRLYRDATLINTVTETRSGSVAGTQTFPVASTYVDTAPATSAASTYSERVIVTSATNVTSASTGNSIGLNLIDFGS